MINLSKNYRINFERRYNVTLEQYLKKEHKDKSYSYEWKEIAYYNSIKGAIKKYIELELRKSTNFNDLINRLNAIETKIDNIFTYRFSPLFNIPVVKCKEKIGWDSTIFNNIKRK